MTVKTSETGWTNATLIGVNLETGEPHHIVGYTFGSIVKGFDTISGKYINHATKIGPHIIGRIDGSKDATIADSDTGEAIHIYRQDRI